MNPPCAPADAEIGAPVVLHGITWDHPRGYAPLEALGPALARRFGLRVDWTRRSLREFGDTSVTELAGRFDWLIIDHPHCGQAARDGVLLPLDTLMSPCEWADLCSDPVGPSLASYQLDGHLWALPIDAAMQSACLRTDLTDHFPDSWDELLASDLPFAVPLCPTDVFCTFLTLCAQNDIPPDGEGRFLQDPRLGKVLRLLRNLCERADPRSLDMNPIQLYEHMCVKDDIAYCPLAFCYIHYADRLRFGPIPGRRHALLGGAGLAISTRCAAPEAVVRAAAWLCGGACQSGPYLKHRGQPAHGRAWRSDIPFFRDLRETLAHAYLRPRIPGWNAFQEEAGLRLHRFLLEKGSVSDLQQELTTIS
ncbi:MAG: hypothetical protein JJU29_16220 [Verrucomicrobia bacterium]|nr:hypothetical protein [Verrucomicrobiota bacterium]MCH8511448.1 hypothetical protein [Kiritimatiellia bacterium]